MFLATILEKHGNKKKMVQPMDSCCDVTILGGGLAGLTLASQLLRLRPDTRVIILEKHGFPVPEGAYKVGESTIEVGAHYLAEEVGLKKHLADDQLPKFGLRFFFNRGRETLDQAIEVGLSNFFPAPGYQVDRGRLENHLARDVAEHGAIVVESANINNVTIGNDGDLHHIEYLRDAQQHSVRSRWVVDASGRAGILKRRLSLAQDIDHNINAVWFRLDAKICVDEWCQNPQWQSRAGRMPRRWLSTNHLLGSGYWVWIIPLSCGATSIGIVADPRLHPLSELNRFDAALAWLERHEPLCAAAVEEQRNTLRDFMAIKRIGYGCREVFSADRWAITGEAGVFLDPLYSPGIDYIAMANTQICSLIDHDLKGTAIDLLAARYQGIFLALFQDNLQTYQDQYPLFGNPRVMSLKYVWDYALYWSFPALLYFNGKLTDPRFFSEVGGGIETIRELNKQMQRFFRDWNEVDGGHEGRAVFVDQNEITILKQLNGELKDRMDDDALRTRFIRNVRNLQDLAAEITLRVTSALPVLATDDRSPRPAQQERLVDVFDALEL